VLAHYAVLYAARTSKHPLVKITKGERIIQRAKTTNYQSAGGGFDASRKMEISALASLLPCARNKLRNLAPQAGAMRLSRMKRVN